MEQNWHSRTSILASAICTVSFGAAFFLAAAPSASAQIPSRGVFYACVQLDRDRDEARLARLVAEDERCRPRETRVHWSVAGPEGPQGPKGAPGAPGLPGPKGDVGPRGPAGPNGTQGFSVAIEPIAVGDANACSALGGVTLTLVDQLGAVVSPEPQILCNGAAGPRGADGPQGLPGPQGVPGPVGPQGPAGTTAQSTTTYFATPVDKDVISLTTPCTFLSGFPVKVTVPADSDVVLSADGAVQTTGTTATTFSIVDLYLVVDGSRSPDGLTFYGFKRISAVNAVLVSQLFNWSVSRRLSLTPGDHQIGLCSNLGAPSSVPANVSGQPTSGLQTALTVTILKR